MKSVRKRAKALSKGREGRLVIPLAFEVAAQISARPLDEFRSDPTQLTNGLVELHKAIESDGIVCALAAEMELLSSRDKRLDLGYIRNHGPVSASLEACKRLRQTFGDQVALLAATTGPQLLARHFNASDTDCGTFFSQLIKLFCEAGVDVLMVMEAENFVQTSTWIESITTARNIASFHQVSLLSWSKSILMSPLKLSLDSPSLSGSGFITTDSIIPINEDIGVLSSFVMGCRGAD
jgi:hypothetical protein